MTLQHSPGPFTYDKIRCSIINGHDKPICEMTQYSYEGDTPLFLAAPDMLRLLRVIVGTDDGSDDFPDNCFRWREAMREASELIARLDGDTCHGK